MYPSVFSGLSIGSYLYGGVSYGTLELTQASPAQTFAEPLEVAEVGAFLRLSDEEWHLEENTLAGMISAAREMAEGLQGRDLIVKQWDLSRDYWPYGPTWQQIQIELRGPLISVDLVKYRDSGGAYTALVENTDYVVDTSKTPGVIRPPYSAWWPSYAPWPSSSLLIRFTSGMDATDQFWSGPGARVKIGMKMLISEWFSNRLPRILGRGETLAMPDPTLDPITLLMSSGAVPRAVR